MVSFPALLSLCCLSANTTPQKKSLVKITSPVYNCRIVEVGYTSRCCFHFYSVVHPALYKVSWNVSCKRFAFFLINNETSRIAKGGITKLQPNMLYLLTIHKLCLVILLSSNIFIVSMRQKKRKNAVLRMEKVASAEACRWIYVSYYSKCICRV